MCGFCCFSRFHSSCVCLFQVLEVNKQWDVQWNNMKTQFEQKVCRFVWVFTDTLEAISDNHLFLESSEFV